jgi:exopolyphosphatase / guanosine-5'-triphosphate,3'-diphosphate pyrophosphatase
MSDPRAIIDIGSNTVRMVIYGAPPRAPAVLFNEKVTARLGKGVAENGQLSAKSMATALAALRRFAAMLRLKGVADWQCVATAAMRDATNGGAFLEQVAALGLEPRLLSGEEEALASARGVIAAFPGAAGVVGDLGGGSLELVDIDGKTCSHGSSMPLGTLQLTRLRAEGGAKFSRNVHKILALDDWAGEHNLPLYLVGGSWRALARYAMYLENWPLDDPHGYEIAPERALTLVRSIGSGKPIGEVPGLSRSRLAALPDAAALLGVLVREIRPSRLVFSSWGLREGLLNGRLSPAAQAQDPLLAGVASFCEKLGDSPSTASMVAGWTVLANPEGGSSAERLRLAATMLALASMQVEPNLRAELAFDWAMRKRWTGIDARGRALLAMTVLANTGRTTIPDSLIRLAALDELREAAAWGLAIRLCRRFSGCSPHSLSGSALDIEHGALVLSVRKPLDALLSDIVERDLASLASWLGLVPDIRILSASARLERTEIRKRNRTAFKPS